MDLTKIIKDFSPTGNIAILTIIAIVIIFFITFLLSELLEKWFNKDKSFKKLFGSVSSLCNVDSHFNKRF